MAMRDDCVRALEGWEEPDGIMLPVLTNRLEREVQRERLRVGLDLLNRILGGS